jgi:Tol biopolymer transport system component
MAAGSIGGGGRPRDIWLVDMARGLPSRFTFDPADDAAPVWSRDGKTVVFASRRASNYDLYQKPADSSRNEELLLSDQTDKYPLSWSPDGRYLLYASQKGSKSSVWVLPLTGDPKPYAFRQTAFSASPAVFSPDGHWVAFVSDESGRNELYVAPFAGPGGPVPVSNSSASQARWSHDGKELFFRRGDGQLVTATLEIQGSVIRVTSTRDLFNLGPNPGPRASFDLSANGQLILVNSLRNPQTATTPPFTVVVNALAEHAKR